MPLDTERQAILSEFARGAALIFDNAEQLYKEACILRGHGSLSRAYCLHQLSNEECGKLELLGGFAITICAGLPYDLKRIAKVLRDHEEKNNANAWDAAPTADELAAYASGDREALENAFEKLQGKLHRLFNTNKNAALYVNFEAGAFSAPKDVVTDELVQEMAILNDYFIRSREPYVRLFRRVAKNEWGFQSIAPDLLERLLSGPPVARFDVAALKTFARGMFDEVLGAQDEGTEVGRTPVAGTPDNDGPDVTVSSETQGRCGQ